MPTGDSEPRGAARDVAGELLAGGGGRGWCQALTGVRCPGVLLLPDAPRRSFSEGAPRGRRAPLAKVPIYPREGVVLPSRGHRTALDRLSERFARLPDSCARARGTLARVPRYPREGLRHPPEAAPDPREGSHPRSRGSPAPSVGSRAPVRGSPAASRGCRGLRARVAESRSRVRMSSSEEAADKDP
jgi:hypothetical protein